MGVHQQLHLEWKQHRANIENAGIKYELAKTSPPPVIVIAAEPPPGGSPHLPAAGPPVMKCPECGGCGFMPTSVDFPKTPTMRQIVRAVSNARGVPLRDIYSDRRHNEVAFARQEIAYLAYEMTPLTFPQIAKHLDRDHTTILHGRSKTIKKMTASQDYAVEINAIRSTLKRLVQA